MISGLMLMTYSSRARKARKKMNRIKRKQMNSGIRLWKHWREVSCYSLETYILKLRNSKNNHPCSFLFLFSESSPSGSDNSDDEGAAGPSASKYNWLCMLLLLYLWIKVLSSGSVQYMYIFLIPEPVPDPLSFIF